MKLITVITERNLFPLPAGNVYQITFLRTYLPRLLPKTISFVKNNKPVPALHHIIKKLVSCRIYQVSLSTKTQKRMTLFYHCQLALGIYV